MNRTTPAPAIKPAPLPFGHGLDARPPDPMPSTAWEWARWTTRRWDAATPGQRAAAVAVLSGHKDAWDRTPAPADPGLVASPVSFPGPAPASPPCFADELLDAVYGRRPQRDNTAGRPRGYTDADAAWWAAESDAMAREDAYDWSADPEDRLGQMDEAEAMAAVQDHLEAGVPCW